MIPVIVAVLTAVSFLPALGGSFLNWDDNVSFLNNPAYRGLGHAQVRNVLLHAAQRAEVWRESETLWRWAIELNPDCSVCHGKLGESALGGPGGAGRVGEPEGFFRRAIALRPDLPEPYFNLGTALALQGRYPEAEGPLRGYMERVPEAAAGPEHLGLLYLVDGRYGAAIPLLRNALLRKRDAPGLRAYLAQALQGRVRELRAEGQDAEAEALLAEARSLGEDAPGPAWSRRMAPERVLQPGPRP